MRFPLAILAVSLLLPAAANAQYGTPAVDSVLVSTASRDTVRARLADLAARATRPPEAIMARYYRGVSFERAARLDSAIACYRSALARAYCNPPRDALVDVLLRRRAAGDVAEAVRILEQGEETEESPEARSDIRPAGIDPERLGWAYVLAGEPARGLELMRPLEPRMILSREGRYHLARAYAEAGELNRAVDFLVELSAESRLQDPEVQDLVAAVERRLGADSRIRDLVSSRIRQRDDDERTVLARLHGRRVYFRAGDGAMLGGVLVADSARRQPARVALVLPVPGTPAAELDSLVAGLRGIGMAVFILDPRGSGGSVSPEFPHENTWFGREDAVEARVARDCRDALTACATMARIDTTRCVAIGLGYMASIVLAAAREDARFAAIALVDPWVPSLARGPALANTRAIQRPTFFQLPSSAYHFHASYAFFQSLYGASPAGASRWIDIPSTARRFRAFGGIAGVTPRFTRWIDDVLPAGRNRKSPASRN